MSGNLRNDLSRSALFTDFYELTMGQAFQAEQMDQQSVFELSFRRMPPGRNYLVTAGLDDVLDYLQHMCVTEEDLDYLREKLHFADSFLERLRHFRFTGDVLAIPEGTPVFPGEPLVQVVAPIFEAQLIETLVLNQVHVQTLAASKAARVITAAAGRQVIEFGARRAHGMDAALKVARCSYLVGAAGTSLVLAGKIYGIPLFGTMAHSYIQSHKDEAEAFAEFERMYPQTTLLVDTYDTLQGVQKVIDLGHKLGSAFRVHAIRLDSGDIGALAKQTRAMLDRAGLQHVQIFASSDLDEYEIARLIQAAAPIDAFGVGTRLAVIQDAPHIDMAYKLVEYAGEPRMKLSAHKIVYPGRKQVFRKSKDGRFVGDAIGRFDEKLEGEPLLQIVMRAGKRLPAGCVGLEDSRRHANDQSKRLPERLLRLDQPEAPYPVAISDALSRELESVRKSLGSG